jgi:hypothetical protein
MGKFAGMAGVVLVVAMTVASGIIHGSLTNRWGSPQAMLDAGEKIQEIPDQFGNWRLASSGTFSEAVKDMLQCVGYVSRAYLNQETAEGVQVFVVVGPAGQISVHTPEVCMAGENFRIVKARRRVTLRGSDGSEHEFWAVDFRSGDLHATTVRVYYGWTTDGHWSAPDHARYVFAGSPYLYKIQLSASLPPGAASRADDPCQKFLRDFVPVLESCLVAPSN